MNVAPGITISRPNTDIDERHACPVLTEIPMQHVSHAAITELQPISPAHFTTRTYWQTEHISRGSMSAPLQLYVPHLTASELDCRVSNQLPQDGCVG